MKFVELKTGGVGAGRIAQETTKGLKAEVPAGGPAAHWQPAMTAPLASATGPAPITKFAANRSSANARALASRQAESNPFASRAQIRLEKVASFAEAAAQAQGRTVAYSISPEVTAFFEALSNNDSKTLKTLTDELVAPKFAANAQSGKRFILALNPNVTEKQRTAMAESLKLGGSATALDEKLSPLVLKPH
jgi:hypothetical protein